MRSLLVSQPASRGLVLITEHSDEVEYLGEKFMVYRGATTRIGQAWMPASDISDSVFDSIEALFAKQLIDVKGIERIFARKDDEFFRIWVVVADTDLDLEDRIYATQLKFMDRFEEARFDFSVIFRQGKDPISINPARARLLYAAQ